MALSLTPNMDDMGHRIRVLVVDDSFSFRMFLRELIESQSDMMVIGESGNGAQATQRVRELVPDVVVMDLKMPGMGGLDAIRQITEAQLPTRIVVVSAFDSESDVEAVMKAGVCRAYRKQRQEAAWGEQLLGGIRGSVKPELRRVEMLPEVPAPARHQTAPIHAVLIGASTGGPKAVAEVLKGLPVPLPVPVLIVLHVAEGFGAPLAHWLSEASGQRVELARGGESLASLKGHCLLAPPDRHMCLERGHVVLSDAPLRHSVRPSVDELFESAVDGPATEGMIGILLTGMGRDGATGLLALRGRGAVTLAQNEATCVVFGMPGEAVRMGAAQQVLPLSAISSAVLEVLKRRGSM